MYSSSCQPRVTKSPHPQGACGFPTRLSVLVAAGWAFAHPAQAEGFRNPPAGAFSLGRAGGRIAQIDDASAIAHNPANLVDLQAPEVQFAPTIVHISTDYQSPLGATAETREPWKLLPNFFAALPLPDQKATLGVGLTTPYGISQEWKHEGAFAAPLGSLRYTAPHFAELKTINANATLAVRLADQVSFGVGIDGMWSELTFEQFYPWFLFGGTEGVAKVNGDGIGVGANAGLTWQVAPRHRLAVTYRSPIAIDYEGDFDVSNFQAVVPGTSPHSEFNSRIEFPTIVSAGYGFQVTDTVRLEADVEWIEFSNFDTLNLDIGNNAVLLAGATSVPQNWKNTFTAGIGGDWQFAPAWVLRASYQFYESPVPDDTFSPTIPDANQNAFTAGVAFRSNHHAAEVAYGAILYDDRDITSSFNPAYNGRYETTVHLFSLSYRYSF